MILKKIFCGYDSKKILSGSVTEREEALCQYIKREGQR
jgi:hypothetical protein